MPVPGGQPAAPAVKRSDGEIFDYRHHDGMPAGNPLKLPEQDYYLSLSRFVDDIASLMSIK
jgi:hypothetical protein